MRAPERCLRRRYGETRTPQTEQLRKRCSALPLSPSVSPRAPVYAGTKDSVHHTRDGYLWNGRSWWGAPDLLAESPIAIVR